MPYRDAGLPGDTTPPWPMEPARVTTLESLPGHAITGTLGVVRGVGRMHASGLSLGQAVETRVDAGYEEAYRSAVFRLMEDAVSAGANAIVGLRVEIGAWGEGVPVCLAYGTAALVE
jgi:uncharacterized protein YbjQ (UPF0145 family)